MASSMTFTYDTVGSVKRIIADWVSAADGSAAGTTVKVCGTQLKRVTDPGAVAPTDNYDIVLTDDKSLDILARAATDLLNRDTANNECVELMLKNYDATAIGVALRPVVCSTITVTISNAGDTKAGQLILYFQGEIYT
jgi:hypothetical protein